MFFFPEEIFSSFLQKKSQLLKQSLYKNVSFFLSNFVSYSASNYYQNLGLLKKLKIFWKHLYVFFLNQSKRYEQHALRSSCTFYGIFYSLEMQCSFIYNVMNINRYWRLKSFYTKSFINKYRRWTSLFIVLLIDDVFIPVNQRQLKRDPKQTCRHKYFRLTMRPRH